MNHQQNRAGSILDSAEISLQLAEAFLRDDSMDSVPVDPRLALEHLHHGIREIRTFSHIARSARNTGSSR